LELAGLPGGETLALDARAPVWRLHDKAAWSRWLLEEIGGEARWRTLKVAGSKSSRTNLARAEKAVLAELTPQTLSEYAALALRPLGLKLRPAPGRGALALKGLGRYAEWAAGGQPEPGLSPEEEAEWAAEEEDLFGPGDPAAVVDPAPPGDGAAIALGAGAVLPLRSWDPVRAALADADLGAAPPPAEAEPADPRPPAGGLHAFANARAVAAVAPPAVAVDAGDFDIGSQIDAADRAEIDAAWAVADEVDGEAAAEEEARRLELAAAESDKEVDEAEQDAEAAAHDAAADELDAARVAAGLDIEAAHSPGRAKRPRRKAAPKSGNPAPKKQARGPKTAPKRRGPGPPF